LYLRIGTQDEIGVLLLGYGSRNEGRNISGSDEDAN
jgi:hypothetical protein